MQTKDFLITRRELLKASVGMAIAMPITQAMANKRSKVVLVRHPDILSDQGKINTKVLQNMLDEAVTALVGVEHPIAAWKTLVKPEDLVGIKSNVWKYLPTPRQVEEAISGRLRDAGVKEGNIRSDDRGALHSLARYNALINIRPLRTHWWSGIGGCIKNYIMFVPEPKEYHGNACENLGAIWHLPAVKGKTRLNILLVLTPLFHGRGPHHYHPRYVWQYKGLLVSFDPVAIDAIGLKLIQAKRLQYFGEASMMETPANHIIAADRKYHLGASDPSHIELLKLGLTENILI
jgi:hypothetical protein